ncbi:hypothetical protein FQA39_LY12896 [Lamprigera yunnana]|nr:hypothetical protein FQA39_LY12896 [Lamprigera yunnana]
MFADQSWLLLIQTMKDIKVLIGKNVINPVNLMVIPVIADDYVDIEFGSGAMKCTPAHDINDFEIGQRHNLQRPICLNVDGTVNEMGGNLYKEKILIMLHPFLPFVTEEIYASFDLEKSILLTNNEQYDFNFDTKYINEVINIVTD